MKTKSLLNWVFYLLPISLVFVMLAVQSGQTGAAGKLSTVDIHFNDGDVLSSSQWAATLSDIRTVHDVVKTNDGHFVVVGNYLPGGGTDGGFLAKLDPNGAVVWQNAYIDSEFDDSKLNAIAELSDNNLVGVGEYPLSGGGHNALVSKFDPDGNVIWQREIGESFSLIAQDVIPLDNGQSLVVARDQGDISDGWLARINANGNVTWQKRYGDGSVNRFLGGVRTSDGNIVLVGTTWETFSDLTAAAWLMKINDDGDILWQKTFNNFWGDYFSDIVETADGKLVVAGGTHSAYGTTYAWALQFNQDGDLIWQREWPDDHVSPFASVAEAGNGQLVFAGQRVNDDSIATGWLVALDGDMGTPLWQKQYGTTTDSDRFAKIISAGDGDLLVVGETDSYGPDDQNGWVLKVGGNGAIPACNLIGSADYASNPTTATIASTAFNPQETTYPGTNRSATVQTFTGQPDNQCYYQVNYTDFLYLPATFTP